MRELLGPEMEEYLDEEAEDVRDAAAGAQPSSVASTSRVQLEVIEDEEVNDITVGRQGNWVGVGGVTGYNSPSWKGKERVVFESLEDEVRACFHNLRGRSLSSLVRSEYEKRESAY